jgi:hypothetical protein
MACGNRRAKKGETMDTGISDANEQWWFNLKTQQVEQGLGEGNLDRLGPYVSRGEAEGALERMHSRTEAQDSDDDN